MPVRDDERWPVKNAHCQQERPFRVLKVSEEVEQTLASKREWLVKLPLAVQELLPERPIVCL